MELGKYFLQESCTDDELEGEELHQVFGELADRPDTVEPSTPGQILRISDEEANLISGTLINDFYRKVIQVFKNIKIISVQLSPTPK